MAEPDALPIDVIARRAGRIRLCACKLAAAAGVSRCTVYTLFQGLRPNPKLATRAKLTRALLDEERAQFAHLRALHGSSVA